MKSVIYAILTLNLALGRMIFDKGILSEDGKLVQISASDPEKHLKIVKSSFQSLQISPQNFSQKMNITNRDEKDLDLVSNYLVLFIVNLIFRSEYGPR